MKTALCLACLLFIGVANGQATDQREAGYEWAELNDIDDVDDCSQDSDSKRFVDGCRQFVKDNYSDEEPGDTDGDDGGDGGDEFDSDDDYGDDQ